jgi:acyl-coenzyme A synthetase/AMP-(fatty) acid ligase
MARMLLDDRETKAALGELRAWLVGGEALGPELVREIRESTKAALFNMYGPTETTVWSTVHAVGDAASPVPIGRPIANTQVYVLDARREPVPFGVTGELYIGGAGVARGYLGRPELTEERFVPNPFAGGRMYKTGDLARLRDDGTLEFAGRRDHQIKIRGHRVELGEIEAAIGRQIGTNECAVVLREDVPGDQRLVGYVAGPVEEARVLESLRASLPEFMVPSRIVSLPELPLTPNRKIDRRALPRPEAGEAVRTTEYVAPTSDIERTIASLWEELLGRTKIGTEDNFFDVGGHSLLVVRMHRRLREIVPQPVTLTDLYRFPTIRSLTDFLTRSDRDGASSGAERAERRREMRRRRASNV